MIAKIEYQPNTTIFIWDYDNFIERKSKKIMTTNSKLIKYWRMKLKKNNLEGRIILKRKEN